MGPVFYFFRNIRVKELFLSPVVSLGDNSSMSARSDACAIKCSGCSKEIFSGTKSRTCGACFEVYCSTCAFHQVLNWSPQVDKESNSLASRTLRICNHCYKDAVRSGKVTSCLYPLVSFSDRGDWNSFCPMSYLQSRDQENDFLSWLSAGRSLLDLVFPDESIPPGVKGFVDNQKIFRISHSTFVKDSADHLKESLMRLEFIASVYLEKVSDELFEKFKVEQSWKQIILPLVSKAIRSVIPTPSSMNAISLENYVRVLEVPLSDSENSRFVHGVVFFEAGLHKKTPCFLSTPKVLVIGFPMDYFNFAFGTKDSPTSRSQTFFPSFISLSNASLEDQMTFESNLVTQILQTQANIVVSNSSMSSYIHDSLVESGIAVLVNVNDLDIKDICRSTGARTLDFKEFEHMSQSYDQNSLGICDCFKITRITTDDSLKIEMGTKSKTIISFERLNPCGTGTILINYRTYSQPALLHVLTKTMLYIGYNLSLELSLLSQQFCSFSEAFCRTTFSQNAQENNKRFRRALSTQLNFSPGWISETLVNLSPFIDSTDWREFLYIKEKATLMDESPNVLADSVSRRLPNSSEHLYPRSFKVCHLLVDKLKSSQIPEILSIELYSNQDLSLGQFLNSKCLSSESHSTSKSICFYHGAGKITIELHRLPLPLDSDDANCSKIYMWSSCKHEDCGRRVTPVVEMASRTFNLSFFRFLEMNFCNRQGICRTGDCGHTLYQNHVQFFGKGMYVASFIHERISRYQLFIDQNIKYYPTVEHQYRNDMCSKLRCSAHDVFEYFRRRFRSFWRKSCMCSNFHELIEINTMIVRHEAHFDNLIFGIDINGETCPFEIFMLFRSLYYWKLSATQLLLKFTPKPYLCTCSPKKFVMCNRHRSSSESRIQMRSFIKQNGPRCDLMTNISTLRSSSQKVDMSLERPYYNMSFKEFLISSETFKQNSYRFENFHDELRHWHFDVSESLGGLYIPIIEMEESSQIAHSLSTRDCRSNLLKCSKHEEVLGSLDVFNKLSLNSAKSREHVIQELLRSEDVSCFSYECRSIKDGEVTRFFTRHFFSHQFFALRHHLCNGDLTFIQSLCRCVPWKASGGKSSASFFKTRDDRFVLKLISEREFRMFLEVAVAYFAFQAECIQENTPTSLVPILGMYATKRMDGSGILSDTRFLVVMPNVVYGGEFSQVFDLKGSSSGRFVAEADEQDIVLQDGNFAKFNRGYPLSLTSSCINLLRESLHRDTQLLSCLGIMDYSLLVAINENDHKVVVGIIDYFRQYTLDKRIENHVKSVAKLFGKGSPTIVHPNKYRERILEAMTFNFIAPPCRVSSDE